MGLGSRDGSACYCLIFPTPIWWSYPVLSHDIPHSYLVVFPIHVTSSHFCLPETTATVSLKQVVSATLTQSSKPWLVSTRPATAKFRTDPNHTVLMLRHRSPQHLWLCWQCISMVLMVSQEGLEFQPLVIKLDMLSGLSEF